MSRRKPKEISWIENSYTWKNFISPHTGMTQSEMVNRAMRMGKKRIHRIERQEGKRALRDAD